MSADIKEAKKDLELVMRDRRSKYANKYTLEEKLEILSATYNLALEWVFNSAAEKESAGTGAASYLMERARLEYFELQRAGSDIAPIDSASREHRPIGWEQLADADA